MRKEIVVRIQPQSDKCHRKTVKVAASVPGVESVSVTGRGHDLLLVIGDVDEVELVERLTEKVGAAEIVELQTLPLLGLGTDVSIVTQSPYNQQRRQSTPGRSVPGGGRIECPVGAGARQQAGSYYPGTPSPLSRRGHYPSPLAGQAGYGSSYTFAVARSHPVNYSPMIARHDYRAVDRRHAAGRGDGREHGGRGPNCCAIL